MTKNKALKQEDIKIYYYRRKDKTKLNDKSSNHLQGLTLKFLNSIIAFWDISTSDFSPWWVTYF